VLPLRRQKILEQLAGKEIGSVRELSDLLSVTEATIRSDLNELAKLGKIVRTHGGARLVEERTRQEYSFQTRKSLNLHAKHKIGEAAAKLVDSLDALLLDSSTTVLAMAHALRNRSDLKDITVIPTGIWTAIELMGCQSINVLLPGGYLRHTSGSITRLYTEEFLADGSKFFQNGLASYASLDQIARIITDKTAPANIIKDIRRQGVEVLVI
jgi:DeoR/GlpR family transcriptional regulator of sugar metabolism